MPHASLLMRVAFVATLFALLCACATTGARTPPTWSTPSAPTGVCAAAPLALLWSTPSATTGVCAAVLLALLRARATTGARTRLLPRPNLAAAGILVLLSLGPAGATGTGGPGGPGGLFAIFGTGGFVPVLAQAAATAFAAASAAAFASFLETAAVTASSAAAIAVIAVVIVAISAAGALLLAHLSRPVPSAVKVTVPSEAATATSVRNIDLPADSTETATPLAPATPLSRVSPRRSQLFSSSTSPTSPSSHSPMMAGSSLPVGVSEDFRSKTTTAAALRLMIKTDHAASIATLSKVYDSLDSNDGALLADCPVGDIISSQAVRRALQSFTWREGPAGAARSFSLIPPRDDNYDYTVKDFWLQLRKVVRPSLTSTLAKVIAAAAALTGLSMASGDYSRGLLAVVALIVSASAFHEPLDLYLADFAPAILRAVTNVALTAQVRAAAEHYRHLTGTDAHDNLLSTMLAIFRSYATDHLATAIEAAEHDGHRPGPRHRPAAAAALLAVDDDDGVIAAVGRIRSENSPSTICDLKATCYGQHWQYVPDSPTAPPSLPRAVCIRAHPPAEVSSVLKARDVGSRRSPARLLTVAALALLASSGQAVPQPLHASPLVDLWRPYVLAAASSAGADGLVRVTVFVGNTSYNALLDPGATTSAVDSSTFASLSSRGAAHLTGGSRMVATVGNAPIRAPLASFVISGTHAGTSFIRTVTAAVIPTLLDGHEFNIILSVKADPDSITAAFLAQSADEPANSNADDLDTLAVLAAFTGLDDDDMPGLLATSAGATATSASPPPTPPVGLRPFVLSDLASCSPDQSHWPSWVASALLTALAPHVAVFAPLDFHGAPLHFPPVAITTTTEAGFNNGRITAYRSFSPSEYASFMGTVHDVIESGHATWLDAYGYELEALPGRAGPGARVRTPSGPAPALPWVHSPVHVPKGDGGARVALDFRPLNAVTASQSQQGMPHVAEILASVAGATLYSKLDARNFHYQVRVRSEDTHKSCFVTPLGIVRLNVVGQGWVNSNVVAQSIMDSVIGPLAAPDASHRNAPDLHSSALSGASTTRAYADDGGMATGNIDLPADSIDSRPLPPAPASLPSTVAGILSAFVSGEPTAIDVVFATGIHDLFVLLCRCSDANLRISWSKVLFLQRFTELLGEVVSRQGRQISPERLQAISDLPVPTSYVSAAAGLGLMGHCRNFIDRYSSLARDFTASPSFRSALAVPKNADRSTRPFTLTAQQIFAWAALKASLLAHVVLAPMDWRHPIVVTTDACLNGIGGVIRVGLQLLEYAYFSASLDSSQANYSVPDLECLAGLRLFERFYDQLRHAPSIIWLTDHANLQHFQKARLTRSIRSVRVSRWYDTIFHLMRLPVTIVHIPSAASANAQPSIVIADALSRLPSPTSLSGSDAGIHPGAHSDLPEHRLLAERAARLRPHPPPDIVAALAAPAFKGRPPKVGSPAWLARQDAIAAWASERSHAATGDVADSAPSAAAPEPSSNSAASSDSELPGLERSLEPSIVPGHIATPPLLGAIVSAQSIASDDEVASWASPPFATVVYHGQAIVTHHGKLWVPGHADELKEELLERAHAAVGHARGGPSIHSALAAAHVAWTGMREDCADWAASSPVRQAAVPPRPNGPSSRDPAPRGAFNPTLSPCADHTVYIDFMGPLTTEAHMSYILVAVDPFTRWVDAWPSPAADAAAAIRGLSAWADAHGVPRTVRCDGGRHFDNAELTTWASASASNISVGPPLHPAGQGMVERRMADLLLLLKTLTTDDLAWPDVLQRAILIINDSLCRSTGISPFHARYGHPRRTPLTAEVSIDDVLPSSPAAHLSGILATQDLALLASAASQAASVARHDAASPEGHPVFAPGDNVLYCANTASKIDSVGVHHIVKERVTDSEYIIHLPLSPADTRRVATERLLPYVASRTDSVTIAEARLPLGTRIIADIVSFQGAASLGTVTFTVVFPDGSTQHLWKASDLHKHHRWRAFVTAAGLPLTPGAAAYAHPPAIISPPAPPPPAPARTLRPRPWAPVPWPAPRGGRPAAVAALAASPLPVFYEE